MRFKIVVFPDPERARDAHKVPCMNIEGDVFQCLHFDGIEEVDFSYLIKADDDVRHGTSFSKIQAPC